LSVTKSEDSKDFPKLNSDAKRGGTVAGNARKETEKEIGRDVSSKENYLSISQKDKKKLENKLFSFIFFQLFLLLYLQI
jgi:hypothetical protein